MAEAGWPDMSDVLDELCEWCFEVNRERPATTLVAGVPLCAACSVSTRQERFSEKKAVLYEPDIEPRPVKAVEAKHFEIRKCEKCGKEFTRDIRKGTSGRFCSRECYETPKVDTPPPTIRAHTLCSRGCGKPTHRGSCVGDGFPDEFKRKDPPKKNYEVFDRKAVIDMPDERLCLCGCGEKTTQRRGYLWGHKSNAKKPPANTETAKPTATQYAIVIADLTAKRDRLSAAIEALISLG